MYTGTYLLVASACTHFSLLCIDRYVHMYVLLWAVGSCPYDTCALCPSCISDEIYLCLRQTLGLASCPTTYFWLIICNWSFVAFCSAGAYQLQIVLVMRLVLGPNNYLLPHLVRL
jgi:hypothetical protein